MPGGQAVTRQGLLAPGGRGQQDHRRDDDQQGWASEGWWNIASQTCETLLKGAVPSRFVYIHAVDYDRGGEWIGKNYMCTTDKSFAIRGVHDCKTRGYKRTGFFEVDTGESQEWTIRLTDPEDPGAKDQ